MASVLILKTLEPAGLERADGRLVLAQPKALALVACLALSKTGEVGRDRLCALLWPDRDADSARNCLRSMLHDLRKADVTLSAALTATRSRLAIDRTVVRSDLSRIDAQLVAGQVPSDLLRAGRLADTILCDLDGIGDPMADWLRQLRVSVEHRWMTYLCAIYENEDHRVQARYAAAEAGHLLDPYAAYAVRGVMSLAASTGDTRRASDCYQRFAARLRADLGITPDAETAQLAQDIMACKPVAPTVQAPPRRRRYYHQRSESDLPVVAVLPFEHIGARPDELHLNRMLAEDIVQRLATQSDVSVMPADTTMGLSEATTNIYQKLRKRGADYVLMGTLHRASDTFHLTVRLTDTDSSVIQTVVRRDISQADLTTIQNMVSSQIVTAVVPGVQDTELRLSQGVSVEQLTAYQLVLQARKEIFRLDRASFERAGKLLREAKGRDPLYAQAYLTLADWYSLRMGQGWSKDPAGDQKRLVKAALDGIACEGWLSRGYAMLGHNKAIFERAFDDAEDYFRRALELAPNDAETLMWTTPTAAFTGRPELALERMEYAAALTKHDPLAFRYEHFLAVAYFACGRFEEAMLAARQSRGSNPKYSSNLRVLAAALVKNDQIEAAHDIAEEILQVEPKFSVGTFLERSPIQVEGLKGSYAEALLRAGLPA